MATPVAGQCISVPTLQGWGKVGHPIQNDCRPEQDWSNLSNTHHRFPLLCDLCALRGNNSFSLNAPIPLNIYPTGINQKRVEQNQSPTTGAIFPSRLFSGNHVNPPRALCPHFLAA